jgi:hypothetical protein
MSDGNVKRMRQVMADGLAMARDAGYEARSAYEVLSATMELFMQTALGTTGTEMRHHMNAFLAKRRELLALESIVMSHPECAEGFEQMSRETIDAYVLERLYAYDAYRANKTEDSGVKVEEEWA